MGFEQTMDAVARGVEVVGILTLVLGLAAALVRAAVVLAAGQGEEAYRVVRTVFGRSILLGLEFLVAADIIRTVAVQPSLRNVAVLGLIVLNLVVLAWIPFRAPDLNVASTFFARLFHPGELTLLSPGVVISLLLVFGLQLIPERPVEVLRARFESLNPAVLGLGLATCVAVVGATVPGQAVPPFIYFQF